MKMRALTLGLLGLAALGLAGCGFTPLYGTPGLTNSLSGIAVSAPQGRVGDLLREHLDDVLAHDRGLAPAYSMSLNVSEQRFPRGIRVDNVASRYEYVLTASYALTPTGGSTVVKRGNVRVEVTYDSSDQPYASVVAQQDAQDRAAEEAARRIEVELAAWLIKPAG